MTQEEYLKQAAAALKKEDAATREEIMEDIRMHFAFGLKQGKRIYRKHKRKKRRKPPSKRRGIARKAS
jgi:hypothetical protein